MSSGGGPPKSAPMCGAPLMKIATDPSRLTTPTAIHLPASTRAATMARKIIDIAQMAKGAFEMP